MEFGKDVFIDLLGYRKYGHNEGDEPRFTQPQLYKAIGKHMNARDIYAKHLKEAGIIDDGFVKNLEDEYKSRLEEELATSRQMENTVITPFMQDEWTGFETVTEETMMEKVKTGVKKETLATITKTISSLPEERNFIRKVKKLIESRQKMFDEDKLDWAMGEHLAYGSLMLDGYNVRMSGQDVERGTFSHRHAVVKSENQEIEFILHNHLDTDQKMYIYNSHLSEYGVVGFEYGYALARPKTLTIWEAQFGDFSNGAQIMMDQYISAGEDKWKNQNGLVMLLPHGYEGQGAEHSSARPERYLQLCARDNMFVANCTTPANMFHLLRRQMLVNYRKPLIVFTPKSLLRSPRATSPVSDFTKGSFQEVIDVDGSAFAKAKTLVFTSGKFYYDLVEYREENNREDVAIVRVEQLFPLPVDEMQKVVKKYKSKDIVWAQEEPRNMGAYAHLLLHMPETRNWRVCSRNMYAAPASGSSTRSKQRQARVIEDVFNNK
jgi:2-oxoglutarate dehydrogenase E1 component